MKRQVAILGDTPEFLRWSVRRDCRLREGTDITSIDETEKRLRAVRAVGQALGQHGIFDGIAAKKFENDWKGFRISEVVAFWNESGEQREGLEIIQQACGDCPANILNKAASHGSLAGCHGWLPRKIESGQHQIDVAELLQTQVASDPLRDDCDWFLETQPIWYGLWEERELRGERLQWIDKQFLKIKETNPNVVRLNEFSKVLHHCHQTNLTLDVELVPAGHSDGIHWRIGLHCDRCKAPFQEGQRLCSSCQKQGQGHPIIKKRVLGLRPYVDLAVVLGDEQAADRFLDEHGLR